MEERTGWQVQNESQIVGEEKWQTCWYCRDQQRVCRMAQASEKLEHTGPAEKERVVSVPQREQLARMLEPPLPKGKEAKPSVQSTRSWGERVKVGESCSLARERWIRARAWRGKGGLHREGRQIPRRKERASKKSLPRTSRRRHKRVSGCKSSPEQSAKSWFHSKSGQT